MKTSYEICQPNICQMQIVSTRESIITDSPPRIFIYFPLINGQPREKKQTFFFLNRCLPLKFVVKISFIVETSSNYASYRARRSREEQFYSLIRIARNVFVWPSCRVPAAFSQPIRAPLVSTR